MPQTQYQVIDVARQYDPAADFPDNPFTPPGRRQCLRPDSAIHTDYEG